MYKFKIGDKVRINRDVSWDKQVLLKGNIYTIIGIDNGRWLKFKEFYTGVNEKVFTLVSRGTTKPYKIVEWCNKYYK
jgi:hypothetical protein